MTTQSELAPSLPTEMHTLKDGLSQSISRAPCLTTEDFSAQLFAAASIPLPRLPLLYSIKCFILNASHRRCFLFSTLELKKKKTGLEGLIKGLVCTVCPGEALVPCPIPHRSLNTTGSNP